MSMSSQHIPPPSQSSTCFKKKKPIESACCICSPPNTDYGDSYVSLPPQCQPHWYLPPRGGRGPFPRAATHLWTLFPIFLPKWLTSFPSSLFHAYNNLFRLVSLTVWIWATPSLQQWKHDLTMCPMGYAMFFAGVTFSLWQGTFPGWKGSGSQLWPCPQTTHNYTSMREYASVVSAGSHCTLPRVPVSDKTVLRPCIIKLTLMLPYLGHMLM